MALIRWAMRILRGPPPRKPSPNPRMLLYARAFELYTRVGIERSKMRRADWAQIHASAAAAGCEGRSASEAITHYIWDKIPPPERVGAELKEGILTGVLHAWFVVGGSKEEMQEPNFEYIIDPCCPDVLPAVLLISPRSPMKILYQPRNAQ